jgi:hypothetical protein
VASHLLQRLEQSATAAKPEIAPALKVFVPAGEVFTEENQEFANAKNHR